MLQKIKLYIFSQSCESIWISKTLTVSNHTLFFFQMKAYFLPLWHIKKRKGEKEKQQRTVGALSLPIEGTSKSGWGG